MQRVCFVPRVKPDRVAEYRFRHREMWPQMQGALRESGWSFFEDIGGSTPDAAMRPLPEAFHLD